MASDHARLAELRAALAAVETRIEDLRCAPTWAREFRLPNFEQRASDLRWEIAALEGRLAREGGEAK